MDYSGRYKRYSRADSKDSRSKLSSKDSGNASLPTKPGSMESYNTAYTNGSRTSRKESGEFNATYRGNDLNRRQIENNNVTGQQRRSGELSDKQREARDVYPNYRPSKGGGEYNSKQNGENGSGKRATKPKNQGKQTKEPESERGRVPV